MTENELMAQHVRHVFNADSEPLFTEAVLKMAAMELMHQTA